MGNVLLSIAKSVSTTYATTRDPIQILSLVSVANRVDVALSGDGCREVDDEANQLTRIIFILLHITIL